MGVEIDSRGIIRHNNRATVEIACPTTVSGLMVGAGEVGTTELADNAVTNAKMADNSVDSAEIVAGAIDTAHIGDLQVTTGKIAALAVTAAELAANAVTTAKILDANVTTAKLAAGAATPAKLTTTGIKFFAFTGRNGAGAITLTGAAVGDRVVAILGSTVASGAAVVGTIPTQFEATITVVNQIQQADAANLTGNDYWVILYPAAA